MNRIVSFRESVVRALKCELAGEGFGIETQDVVKPNDQILHGIAIRPPGSNIGLTYYVDGMETMIPSDFASQVINTLSTQKAHNPSEDLTLEAVKDSLSLHLLEKRRNRLYLQDKPYRHVAGDLVLIAHINRGDRYMAVTNTVMQGIGIDSRMLFDTAIQNAQKKYPAILFDLNSLVEGQWVENLMSAGCSIPADRILTLTVEGFPNDQFDQFGAAAIAYPGVLDKIMASVGSFYILPSSIQEVLIVPESSGARLSDLSEMVREANRYVVAPNDILSDNVLYYNGVLKEAKNEDRILH